MKLTLKLKKQITEDWLKCFPDLGIFKPMWLLRRIGPIVLGILLDRDSSNEAYRPTFHVHNLSKPSTFITLTLMEPLLTIKTSAPETLRADFHSRNFEDAADRLRRQIPVPLTGPIRQVDIINAYKRYMKQPLGRFPLHLFEDIITIHLWCGDPNSAEQSLSEFEKEITNWPSQINVLKLAGGVQQWLNKCHVWIRNPEQLIECINSQLELHKLESIPYSEFVR